MVDLSQRMLDRALQRIRLETTGNIITMSGDIRTIDLPESKFEIIVAGAVLHHLRDECDWYTTFEKLYQLLKPGGCLFVSDLLSHEIPEINDYMIEKYGEYLVELNGIEYRNKVFDYIEKEDTPKSLSFQLMLMKNVGFRLVEVLHKNVCFGAYCGIK